MRLPGNSWGAQGNTVCRKIKFLRRSLSPVASEWRSVVFSAFPKLDFPFPAREVDEELLEGASFHFCVCAELLEGAYFHQASAVDYADPGAELLRHRERVCRHKDRSSPLDEFSQNAFDQTLTLGVQA